MISTKYIDKITKDPYQKSVVDSKNFTEWQAKSTIANPIGYCKNATGHASRQVDACLLFTTSSWFCRRNQTKTERKLNIQDIDCFTEKCELRWKCASNNDNLDFNIQVIYRYNILGTQYHSIALKFEILKELMASVMSTTVSK